MWKAFANGCFDADPFAHCATIHRKMNKNDFSIRARFKCMYCRYMLVSCIQHINFQPTLPHKSSKSLGHASSFHYGVELIVILFREIGGMSMKCPKSDKKELTTLRWFKTILSGSVCGCVHCANDPRGTWLLLLMFVLLKWCSIFMNMCVCVCDGITLIRKWND